MFLLLYSKLNIMNTQSVFLTLLIGGIIGISDAAAQQTEYRITDDGKYQYLSNRDEAGMIFDESLGAYYKNITVRTFFLETQRKGYIPYYVTYEGFLKLTAEQKKAILKQPYKDPQCSSGHISPECLEFSEPKVVVPKSEDAKVVDLSPKCEEPAKSTGAPSLTSKLLLNPNDATIVNNDCGDEAKQSEPSGQTSQQKQNQIRNVKTILGKD